jgi:gas vesicle protein
MIEAILLAFAAFLYAAFISFTSMAVSVFFGRQHLLLVGHVIVLIVFCGGGLGLVGWTKQKLGSPLVNVACSLTSLALITVLTKEGAVQAAKFSYIKVWQVLKMIIMGTVASSAVALLIRPSSARNEFRDTFIKATDAMGEMLTLITRSFLSGSEADLKTLDFIEASDQSKSTYKTLVKNLGEAKYEHYALGTEEEHKIASRLVKCLEELMQSIGGLRSAAETQFALLAQTNAPNGGVGTQMTDLSTASSDMSLAEYESSPVLSPCLSHTDRRSSILASIDEVPESPADISDNQSGQLNGKPIRLPQGMQSNLTPADMFTVFIAHLGPPMVHIALCCVFLDHHV